jgi:hypothetical protein
MNRIASTLAFAGTVVAASLAATVTPGEALAETPTIDTTPFVSTLSRAEVRAELLRGRQMVSAAGSEWAMQQNRHLPVASGLTRAQVTAEYIAAREEARALTSEDSGASYFAMARTRTPGTPGTLMAGSGTR